jgi:hypothetical protein
LEKGVPTPNADALLFDGNVMGASKRNTPVAFVRNSISIWFNTLEDDKSDLKYDEVSQGPAEADGNTSHQTISQNAKWEKGELSNYEILLLEIPS